MQAFKTATELTDDERALCDATLKSFNEWKMSIITRLDEVLHANITKGTSELLKSKAADKSDGYGDFIIPKTSLENLDLDTKKTIISSVLLLSLSLSTHNYDPRSRVLLHVMSSSLKIPASLLLTLEKDVARILVSAAMKADQEETKKRQESAAYSRKWKMGLAGLAGGILVGVTGYDSPPR
jgi:hypothetical protein